MKTFFQFWHCELIKLLAIDNWVFLMLAKTSDQPVAPPRLSKVGDYIEASPEASAAGDVCLPTVGNGDPTTTDVDLDIASLVASTYGMKPNERLEVFINKMMQKEALMSLSQEEQIASKKHLLEELMKVEQELQERAKMVLDLL